MACVPSSSLPVPRMYTEQNTSLSSSSSDSPRSIAPTTPSAGFMQPWLNVSRNSPVQSDNVLPGSSMPTPPSASTNMMQQQMNMMHPIYMYSSPYFQYPPMYPYSSMFQPNIMSQINQQHSENSAASLSVIKSPDGQSAVDKDNTKNPPNVPLPVIPQAHSYSHLTATPVHQQLSRSDRRNSLSSECSSSPSDTSVSRTDVSVDGPTSDSEMSRSTDSGNSSMRSESINSATIPDVISEPIVKTTPLPVKSSPEPLYKKKARTNYTPEQVRGLEKVFLETPYPEPDAMEKLSRELDIAEQKLKVWFQNKRARWRRRVQDNKHSLAASVPSVYMPTMMPPYGFMPAPTMPHTANPMMAGSYYPYQAAAQAHQAVNGSFGSQMQKFGFPCMY